MSSPTTDHVPPPTLAVPAQRDPVDPPTDAPTDLPAARAAAAAGGPAAPGRLRAGWGDAGMTTAEYAIGTVAACAFAGILLVIVRSDAVREALLGILRRALAMTG